MTRKAWIAGLSGLSLTDAERDFFAASKPFGFILFGRNVGSDTQLAALCAELASFADDGTTIPIFIDQEGGRVRRLRPPLAPHLPAGEVLGAAYARDPAAGLRAAHLHGQILAASLRRYGINADCIPCLDLAVDGAHSVIGDRAMSGDPDAVAALGRAMAEAAMANGVLAVMKHLPGHGRAMVDSHLDLPRLGLSREELDARDARPFALLADLPAAMTAHILFEAIDPDRPATLSPRVIDEVIRTGIGFDGLLMTDDISMKALKAPVGDSAGLAIEAGCDIVLHCNGDMAEMRDVAAAVPVLSGRAAERAERARAIAAPGRAVLDIDELLSEYQQLVSPGA